MRHRKTGANTIKNNVFQTGKTDTEKPIQQTAPKQGEVVPVSGFAKELFKTAVLKSFK